ncbi:MAG: tryptophan synthase subunit alpha [Rhodoluna sp.]|jgi:tryptophan synthase alpha chain
MSSVETIIRENKSKGVDTLIGYFPAGYPTLEASVEACVAMCEAGVDVLELGIPYSDPVMDGLVIQQATEVSLANGFKIREISKIIKAIRQRVDTPILVMSYWNPIIQYGVKQLAEDLVSSGAQGMITPDLIPDEAAEWLQISDEYDLDRVFMATPSSSTERLAKAANSSRGFVYGVSTMGITGTREDLDAKARAVVSGVRDSRTSTPVCVGIGISTAEQVSEVNSYADGAIVGSAIIKAYNEAGIDGLVNCVRQLKTGK